MLALAPAASATVASAATDGPPTYTCQTDGPAPRLYPPWVHGIDCQASSGAPVSGIARGPLNMIINQPRFTPSGIVWTCEQVEVLDGTPGALRVMGRMCQERRN